MLAETVTRWRREAIDEGRQLARRQGASLERTLLRRLAQRFDVAPGDGLAALLANEDDVERLAEVGDLAVDCGNAQELPRRGRDLLDNGNVY